MMSKAEPRWITIEAALAIHDLMLATYGGLGGVRDRGALESALARPQHRWHYRETDDVTELASSYGFGLAKNHPFVDGNKRTAFVVMATFLEDNGTPFRAAEADAVITMIAVADGSMSERRLATWLGDNVGAATRAGRKRRAKG